MFYYLRYRVRDLKYQYYDLADEAHDAVSAHPVTLKQCGVAVCGFLSGAMLSLFCALAFKRRPKR